MKRIGKITVVALLFLSTPIHAQFDLHGSAPASKDSIKTHGVFYKFSFGGSLAINEDYDPDYTDIYGDPVEPFFEFGAIFLNNTVGYQFDKRSSLGLNFEYAWHSKQGLHFFPAYLSFRHNIGKEYLYFIRGGYGTFLGISKDFEKGNMYKFGIGVNIDSEKGNTTYLIGLDFTRKRFGYRNLEGLSSFSIFFDIIL
jgi:hypothetical protein